MTRPVIWMPEALDDLGETLDYLALHDEDRALSIIEQLREAGDKLGEIASGHPGRVAGTFEKSLPRLRYILVFDVDRRSSSGPLHILRVIHTARNWRKGEWPAD